MPVISALINQIKHAQITVNIIHDSRGVSPGGTMVIELIRAHRCFATLLIRTLHPANKDQFNNIDSYSITEVSIDNAEVIVIRTPMAAYELWNQLDTLLRERHTRAKEALAQLPNSNPRPHQQPFSVNRAQNGHNRRPFTRYRDRHKRRFPDRFYPATTM